MYGLVTFIALWAAIMTVVCISTWNAAYTKAYIGDALSNDPFFNNDYWIGRDAADEAWSATYTPLMIGVCATVVLTIIAYVMYEIFDLITEHIERLSGQVEESGQSYVDINGITCKDPDCACAYHGPEQYDTKTREWDAFCRNPDCRCNYHEGGYFDTSKGAWKEYAKNSVVTGQR